MRIAFVSHSRRKIGGAEVYLDSVMPAFAAAGHDVAWLYETDPASERGLISFPPAAPAWPIAGSNVTKTLDGLRKWGPGVVFSHGLFDPELEAAVIAIAPSVLYVHNYYGTCIS